MKNKTRLDLLFKIAFLFKNIPLVSDFTSPRLHERAKSPA